MCAVLWGGLVDRYVGLEVFGGTKVIRIPPVLSLRSQNTGYQTMRLLVYLALLLLCLHLDIGLSFSPALPPFGISPCSSFGRNLGGSSYSSIGLVGLPTRTALHQPLSPEWRARNEAGRGYLVGAARSLSATTGTFSDIRLERPVLVKVGSGLDSVVHVPRREELLNSDRMTLIKKLASTEDFGLAFSGLRRDQLRITMLRKVAGRLPTVEEEADVVELEGTMTAGELMLQLDPSSKAFYFRASNIAPDITTTASGKPPPPTYPDAYLLAARALPLSPLCSAGSNATPDGPLVHRPTSTKSLPLCLTLPPPLHPIVPLLLYDAISAALCL